jgi:hypothetical protein
MTVTKTETEEPCPECLRRGLRRARAERVKWVENGLMEVIHDHDNADLPLDEQFEALTNVLVSMADLFDFRGEAKAPDQKVLERITDAIRKRMT